MRYETNLLMPVNRCPDVSGIERQKASLHGACEVYESDYHFRLVAKSPMGSYVSGMIIDKRDHEIVAIYTDPAYSRKGYAKGLVLIARQLYKRLHVVNMTAEGERFFNGFSGIIA